VEACPSRPWGMADRMVAPVEGRRTLLRSWGRVGDTAACPTIVEKDSHSDAGQFLPYLFYCVAELHSERGKATQWLE